MHEISDGPMRYPESAVVQLVLRTVLYVLISSLQNELTQASFLPKSSHIGLTSGTPAASASTARPTSHGGAAPQQRASS